MAIPSSENDRDLTTLTSGLSAVRSGAKDNCGTLFIPETAPVTCDYRARATEKPQK
jgi:hypothetical protein